VNSANDKVDILKADGFDEAVVGIGRRCGKPDLIVYDIQKCAEILRQQSKDAGEELSWEEAIEYLEFNSIGAWMGEGTPIWLERKTLEEIEDEING
jgi:hypothetical protein